MAKIDGSRLGNINARSVSPAKFGHKKFTFDGTMTGLIEAAQAVGIRVGNIFQADFGGGYRRYVLVAAPHDNRCNGVWADEIPTRKRKAIYRPKNGLNPPFT
jgi:hypothetical protein